MHGPLSPAPDLIELAIRLGVDRQSLAAKMTQLHTDVAGDDNIDDAHPRFGDHVALIAWASETWPTVEGAMNEAATGPDAGADSNRVERWIIGRVMQEV